MLAIRWWSNGWMDQDGTWYRGRYRLRRHCVRWGPHGKGHSSPHFSAHVCCGQTVAHLSNCWAVVCITRRKMHYRFSMVTLVSTKHCLCFQGIMSMLCLHVFTVVKLSIIMVALCNRETIYIFILWFLSSIFLLFFPRLISAVGDWMSTILLHMAWP